MKDIGTIARDNALNCEAKKHAYRQTQDGVVVSFVLHPQEVPEQLALAALGTRFMLAMVEINEDETPKESEGAPRTLPRRRESRHQSVESRDQGAVDPSRPHKSWHEMTPAQQAGILCADGSFYKFMIERIGGLSPRLPIAQAVPQRVREICKVKSRSDIVEGDKSNDYWQDLVSKYRAWQREPEVIG